MGRIDECLKNKKYGMTKVSKKLCRNNCKREDCKYIGMRHNKTKPIDRPHNKELKKKLQKLTLNIEK